MQEGLRTSWSGPMAPRSGDSTRGSKLGSGLHPFLVVVLVDENFSAWAPMLSPQVGVLGAPESA